MHLILGSCKILKWTISKSVKRNNLSSKQLKLGVITEKLKILTIESETSF